MKLVNILVTWIFLAAMIAANALANILPINQLNTGQIFYDIIGQIPKGKHLFIFNK
jgi:hypothetical protein